MKLHEKQFLYKHQALQVIRDLKIPKIEMINFYEANQHKDLMATLNKKLKNKPIKIVIIQER